MEHNGGGVEVEKDPDLREISFGIWEGHNPSEVKELDHDKLIRWRAAPFSVTPDGGETLEELTIRASRAARGLTEPGMPGGVTFVVAHGGILRALLAILMKFEDMNITWKMRMDNCSITVVDIWEKRVSLHILNDTHHCRMPDDESTASLSFSL
jgi:broad specificity phosphatase PhoE